MKRMLLVLVGGLLMRFPLQAQTPEAARHAHGAPVTLVSITGVVAPVRDDEPPLPFEVLENLERDPFLTQLHTEPRAQTGPALLITFSFPSVQAYRAWSAAPHTRALLDLLRQRVSQLELTVSLTRGTAAALSAPREK